ncbi:MAG: radical SAM protein [Alkaliphilus sp.]
MYNVAVICMTNKCNASCEFCCFSCNPQNNNTLQAEEVEKVIDDLLEREHIHQIVFTGGEPFLYYQDLKRYFKRIFGSGKGVGVFTNAHWCASRDITYQYLYELKKLGLGMIRTSIDVFHQKYIDIKCVKRLLETANELDILTHINVAITMDTIDQVEEYIKKLGVSKLNASFTYSPMLPIGAALGESEKFSCLRTKKKEERFCIHGGLFAVLFDGSIFPCCSQYIAELPLKYGNIQHDKINQVLDKMEDDKLLYLITNHGFDWIIELLEKEGNHKFDEKYVDSCQLCHQIFSKESNYELIQASVESEYERMVKNEN